MIACIGLDVYWFHRLRKQLACHKHKHPPPSSSSPSQGPLQTPWKSTQHGNAVVPTPPQKADDMNNMLNARWPTKTCSTTTGTSATVLFSAKHPQPCSPSDQSESLLTVWQTSSTGTANMLGPLAQGGDCYVEAGVAECPRHIVRSGRATRSTPNIPCWCCQPHDQQG